MIYTEIRNIVYILIRKMVKVMKKAEVVTRLIKEAGYSKRAFAEKIGLPPHNTAIHVIKRDWQSIC